MLPGMSSAQWGLSWPPSIHAQTQTHIHIHTRPHVHTRAHMCIHIHRQHTQVYTCAHTCRSHTHTHTYSITSSWFTSFTASFTGSSPYCILICLIQGLAIFVRWMSEYTSSLLCTVVLTLGLIAPSYKWGNWNPERLQCPLTWTSWWVLESRSEADL